MCKAKSILPISFRGGRDGRGSLIWWAWRLPFFCSILLLMLSGSKQFAQATSAFTATEENSRGAVRCYRQLTTVRNRMEALLEAESQAPYYRSSNIFPASQSASGSSAPPLTWNQLLYSTAHSGDPAEIWKPIDELALQIFFRARQMQDRLAWLLNRNVHYNMLISDIYKPRRHLHLGVLKLLDISMANAEINERKDYNKETDSKETLHTTELPVRCLELAIYTEAFLHDYDQCVWLKSGKFSDMVQQLSSTSITVPNPLDPAAIINRCMQIENDLPGLLLQYAALPQDVDAYYYEPLVQMAANVLHFMRKGEILQDLPYKYEEKARVIVALEFAKLMELRQWLRQAKVSFSENKLPPTPLPELLYGDRKFLVGLKKSTTTTSTTTTSTRPPPVAQPAAQEEVDPLPVPPPVPSKSKKWLWWFAGGVAVGYGIWSYLKSHFWSPTATNSSSSNDTDIPDYPATAMETAAPILFTNILIILGCVLVLLLVVGGSAYYYFYHVKPRRSAGKSNATKAGGDKSKSGAKSSAASKNSSKPSSTSGKKSSTSSAPSGSKNSSK